MFLFSKWKGLPVQQLNFVYHNLLQGSQVISIGFRPLEVDLKVSKSITPIELDTVSTFTFVYL